MLLVIAVIVLLFVGAGRRQSRLRKAAIMNEYNRIVSESGLYISFKEELANKILAFDAAKRMLVFVSGHGELKYDLIDLSGVSHCTVRKAGSRITLRHKSGKETTEEHISEVLLSFSYRDQTVAELPVYSEIHDGLMELLPLTAVAEQWQNRVQAFLTKQAS